MIRKFTTSILQIAFLVCFIMINTVTSILKIRVGVVTMIRNEPELLPLWIEYHVELFGVENVAVIDNFSSDEITLRILQSWESKGLHVLYKQGPYKKKGDLTYGALKSFFPFHHIALPLDIDEFLVTYHDGIPVINKQLTHHYLNEFWLSESPCYGFKQYDYISLHSANSSIQNNELWCSSSLPEFAAKKMTRMDLLIGLDHGNHHNTMRYNIAATECTYEMNKLGLLHYIAVDPQFMIRKAIYDCIGFGYLPANATTLEAARPYLEELRDKKATHLNGWHKVARLISVLEHGPNFLVMPCSTKATKVGSLPQIIEMLKQT